MGPLDLPGVRREMLGCSEGWDPKEGVLFLRCMYYYSPQYDPVSSNPVSSNVEVNQDISDHDFNEKQHSDYYSNCVFGRCRRKKKILLAGCALK